MPGKRKSLRTSKTAKGVTFNGIYSAQSLAGHENVLKALEETQALFQLLFESAPDANILVTEQGSILAVNTQAEHMFGYQRTELIGNDIEILLPDRFHHRHLVHRGEYVKLPHMRAMDTGLELIARRKNGDEFLVDVMLSPLQMEDGVLVLSVIRDITLRKNIQAELNEVRYKLLHKTEQERSHLARELHDGPIQELYALAFQLGELSEKYPGDEEVLNPARARLQDTIMSLRAIMSALRPPTLTPFGLESTIRSHAEEFKKVYPQPVLHLNLYRDGQRLPEEMRLALFRIYQEALANAARHAKASNVFVDFAIDADSVRLSIRDDGIGFEPPDHWVLLPRQGHYGLVGIRERVEALDGQLELVSTPGQGTLLQITVPLDLEP